MSNLERESGNQNIRMQSIRTSGYQEKFREKELLNLMSLYPDTHNLMS